VPDVTIGSLGGSTITTPEVSLDDNITFLVIMGVWLLLQMVVLPAMGVPT